MASVSDIQSQLTTLQTTIDTVQHQVTALKNQPPPVATQGDLDGISASLNAAQNALAAIATS